MSEELLDDLSLLIFKNQLLCGSMDQLKDFYKDEKRFLSFLDTIALVSQREPAFFLLSSELKNRILQIVEIHRFSANGNVLDYINEILVYLNSLDSMPDNLKDIIVKSYMSFHEELRGNKFEDNEQFLQALSYDAIFVSAIDENNMSLLKRHDLNMSSFNYLICTSPEFFEKKDVIERAMYVLNSEEKNAKIFSKKKKQIRNVKKVLNNITKKEE